VPVLQLGLAVVTQRRSLLLLLLLLLLLHRRKCTIGRYLARLATSALQLHDLHLQSCACGGEYCEQGRSRECRQQQREQRCSQCADHSAQIK
jgi:hypothetical protein